MIELKKPVENYSTERDEEWLATPRVPHFIRTQESAKQQIENHFAQELIDRGIFTRKKDAREFMKTIPYKSVFKKVMTQYRRDEKATFDIICRDIKPVNKEMYDYRIGLISYHLNKYINMGIETMLLNFDTITERVAK